jgi:hypothetical protein
MSSSGEMKMSLRLIICGALEAATAKARVWGAHILVPEVLEKLQLAVCTLGQDRSTEGLHDLLDGHGLAGELVLGRAAPLSVPRRVLRAGGHTRQAQRHPCRRAADPCTFATSVSRTATRWGAAMPACNLERRAEDLGAHEFSHGARWFRSRCDGRGWERLQRGGGWCCGVVEEARSFVLRPTLDTWTRTASRLDPVEISTATTVILATGKGFTGSAQTVISFLQRLLSLRDVVQTTNAFGNRTSGAVGQQGWGGKDRDGC